MSPMRRSYLLIAVCLLGQSLVNNTLRAAEVAATAPAATPINEESAKPVGADTPHLSLAERIPSVSQRSFTKQQSLQLAVGVGLSLNDPFYRYAMPSVSAQYYFNDAFALGLQADYLQGNATPIAITGGTLPILPAFNQLVGGARLLLSWLPIYGKISWLAEHVAHFDTYLTLGLGLAAAKHGSNSFDVTLALGQHYFINSWLALRLEAREEIYRLARNVGGASTLQNLLSVSLGLAFYVPLQATPSAKPSTTLVGTTRESP